MKRDMDQICGTCGKMYGEHFGESCPDWETTGHKWSNKQEELKMKPFDLEAAKRGETFGYQFHDGGCGPRVFIGVRSNGEIVYEHPRTGSLDSTSATNLCMLPRKVVRWVNIYRSLNGALFCGTTSGGFLTKREAQLAGNLATTINPPVGTARVEWEE